MLNIVIPMAGRGSRFIQNGYSLPKPLIDIHGVPMIRCVIENLKPNTEHKFIFICQDEHLERFDLQDMLYEWAPNCEVISIDRITDGAACTVLLAKSFINNDNPLMIANCDQWIDCNINDYLHKMSSKNLDGLIMTMKANDAKWSFVSLREGLVTNVVEKVVVSDEATVGIYNFSKGRDFVQAAETMIKKDIRANNEFYVAPVYNELIALGHKIETYNIGSEANGMYGLGVPEDLELFLTLDVSLKAVAI